MSSSRFIQYLESYVQADPDVQAKLTSADISLVGRVLRHVPLTFTVNDEENEKTYQVLNPRFIERWYQQNKELLTQLTLNDNNKVPLTSAQQESFKQLVDQIIQIASSELLDSFGRLHSQVIYFLHLKYLIAEHGAEKITSRVLWSYCHELVGAALSAHLQTQLELSHLDATDEARIPERLLSFNLAYSHYCTLEVITEKVAIYQHEQQFLNMMDHLNDHITKALLTIPSDYHAALEKFMLQDISRINGLKDNNELHEKIYVMRRAFWADMQNKLSNKSSVLQNMITSTLKQAKPELNDKVSYRFIELQPWLNIRDNRYILHDLMKFADFQKNKSWHAVSDLIHRTLVNKQYMELDSSALLVSLARSDSVLKNVVQAYMPSLDLGHRHGFFNNAGASSSARPASKAVPDVVLNAMLGKR